MLVKGCFLKQAFVCYVLVFAMLGMLSPASRGALMTAAIFLYVFMGLIAGYVSARLYKTIKGRKWKRAAFLVTMIHKLLKKLKMRL